MGHQAGPAVRLWHGGKLRLSIVVSQSHHRNGCRHGNLVRLPGRLRAHGSTDAMSTRLEELIVKLPTVSPGVLKEFGFLSVQERANKGLHGLFWG